MIRSYISDSDSGGYNVDNKDKKIRIFHIVYIVIFFVICCMPLLLWAPLKNEKPIGNTALAQFPDITDDSGKLNGEFFSQFGDYFTDHLPLRQYLVTADNYIKAQIFGSSAANVIQGKYGYIFSQETVNDYVGVTSSQRKIYNIARTVKLMQDKAVDGGNNFVFTVIPNKNSLYPEYMPDRYIKGESSDLSLLSEKLGELGVNYADMYHVLEQYGNVYLKRDTHWNGLGALYGFNAIMGALGKQHKDYNGAEYTYTNDWRGDIDKLLYPVGGVRDSQYYFEADLSGVTFLSPALEGGNDAILKELMSDNEKYDTMIKTMNVLSSGKLLMMRDSFARAMLPFIIENYRSTTITRSMPFVMTSLEDETGVDVVYEIVERNLGKIVESAPIMEALETQPPQITSVEGGNNIIKADITMSYVKIYGVLDEKYFDDDSRIFVTCKGSESRTYEAFPICESELLGLDEPCDTGFSLILPSNIPSGEYEVSVTVTSGRGNVSTGVLTTLAYDTTADE